MLSTARPRPIRLLLVEDDFDVAAGLAAFLEPRGIEVEFSYSKRAALALALDRAFDLAVIDIELPDGDGRDLCRSLRSRGFDRPVIILTARTSLEDKLAGFDAGAVDYVVKPFAPAELHARMLALIRQLEMRKTEVALVAGDFTFDPKSGVLTRGAGMLVVSGTAREILRLLIERSPGVVPRSEFDERLWQGDVPASDPLRMHIYELRRMLGDTFGIQPIVTVRGTGYSFGGPHANL